MATRERMETLVRELNNPAHQSSPEVINTVQKSIQRLQREPVAWQWAIELLNHHEAVMRFYGALTLTIKINADWDIDKVGEDRDLVNNLLESLVSAYVRLASVPDVPFVLQKLCTTLVAFFQKPQAAWALPVRHLIACAVANRYVPQNMVPDLPATLISNESISGAQLRYLLMFPVTLAEQDGAISGSVKEQHVRIQMSNNVPDILRLMRFAALSIDAAQTGGNSTSSDHKRLSVHFDQQQLLEVVKTLLQLVPLWTGDVKISRPHNGNKATESNFDFFAATVEIFPRLFQEESLAPSILQTLTSLEETCHKLLQKALPLYETHIVNSVQAQAWIEQLLSGDFDPDAVAYVNFLEACMSQVDVTSPDYLNTGCYIAILKQVQTILQCDGAPGVDDVVCQVSLEIMTSVTEGFSDWPEPCQYDESMRELIRAACSSALNKIRIPRDELSTKTQTWDADDRAKFQDFRYDVQDYLQNAFSILGDSLIEEIARMTTGTQVSTEWDLFEGGLFGLLAFSDTISNEPERYDQYPQIVFSCEKWQLAVNTGLDVPDRVRQVMIKVIGENTGFLQRHTDFLVPSLNFLFTSLHMESLATPASRAIASLCDSQRSMLTEALPEFMSSLNSITEIELDAKHRIYAAVGAIIQALPSESTKIQPLTQILSKLWDQDVEIEMKQASGWEDLLTKAVDIVQTLASLGRGLRTPSDAAIELEKTEDRNSEFWTSGQGSVVQQLLLQIYENVLQQVQHRLGSSFIEAACGFIRSGFTEDHPSPFKFSNSKTLELLSTYVTTTSTQPDLVMSTASSYLSSVRPKSPTNEFKTLFIMTINPVSQTYNDWKFNSTTLNTDFNTAALEFYARLLPKWALNLFNIPEAPEAISLLVQVAESIISNQDTLPRRAAAQFYAALFEASGQPAISSNPTVAAAMSTVLQTHAGRIIAQIVHLLAGVCARSETDTLAEVLKRAVQKQPMMTNRILKEVLKAESQVLRPIALEVTTPEQRARFAAQVEMLRGARQTNDIVRDFWVACRGSNFEYVT